MKKSILRYLLCSILLIFLTAVIAGQVCAQTSNLNFLSGSYYPVWSITGIGAPWWAHITCDLDSSPYCYPWPSTMIIPYPAGLGTFGVTGFAGIGLARMQPPIVPPYQGFQEMSGILSTDVPPYPGFQEMSIVPPCFGLFVGLGMGAFGGLGMTRFGSPDAISSMGLPWNWQPFFGVTSTARGNVYLDMYMPWWFKLPPITDL